MAASGSAAANGLDRQVGRIDRDGHRPGLDPGETVTDLEQPARPDAEERIASEPLATLDRLEEVGRTAVVEPQEGPDRGLEVGRSRGAQEDRVGGGGKALRLRQADRIGCRHRGSASENQNDLRLRDERSCLPRCHPHSAMPHSRDRRPTGVPTADDRRCPLSLALCAGAYWRPRLAPPRVRSGGSRVHSLSSSFRLAPAAGSLCRRATGTRPVHSPLFVMWRGVWPGRAPSVKRLRRRGAAAGAGCRTPRCDVGRRAARRMRRSPVRRSPRGRGTGQGPTGRVPGTAHANPSPNGVSNPLVRSMVGVPPPPRPPLGPSSRPGMSSPAPTGGPDGPGPPDRSPRPGGGEWDGVRAR